MSINIENVQSIENFEKKLIKGIDPIRNFVLATSLYHLFRSGLFGKIEKENCVSLSHLALTFEMDEVKLRGFIQYLVNENVLQFEKDQVFLTDYGASLSEFEPWYIMLIGGYGNTFLQIGEKLSYGSGYASRNCTEVGIGSCRISHYDSIPLTFDLIKESEKNITKVLDIGCGNGLYLLELCNVCNIKEAIGIEPDLKGCEIAQKFLKQKKVHDRIKIINSNALDFIDSGMHYKPDLVIIAFVLHEILSQSGERGVISFLKKVVNRFPKTHLVIIEVDNKISDHKKMMHPLGRCYYNPYYLLHYFTNQRLEAPSFWEDLFLKANLEIISKKTTNPQVDSTELELGYLLKRK